MVAEVVEKKSSLAALCRQHGVDHLSIFGSATSRSAMSDIHDLGFLVTFKPTDPVTYAHAYFSLAEKLESLFQTSIDLIELDAIDNPYFREEVEETRVTLYESA